MRKLMVICKKCKRPNEVTDMQAKFTCVSCKEEQMVPALESYQCGGCGKVYQYPAGIERFFCNSCETKTHSMPGDLPADGIRKPWYFGKTMVRVQCQECGGQNNTTAGNKFWKCKHCNHVNRFNVLAYGYVFAVSGDGRVKRFDTTLPVGEIFKYFGLLDGGAVTLHSDDLGGKKK